MTYIYKSGLKSYILGLITQKRADGFAYISEEQLFRQLDNFCMEYFPDARTITYDFAARWSSARPFEGNGYHNRRISALRQLSLYILSLGKTNPHSISPQRMRWPHCSRKWMRRNIGATA